jgi:hypothetical protein
MIDGGLGAVKLHVTASLDLSSHFKRDNIIMILRGLVLSSTTAGD